MKNILFILTLMFVILATAAPCFGQATRDTKDPFGQFEKPAPARVGPGDVTFSNPDPIATEVFTLKFANAKDIGTIVTTLLSSGGKMGIDERLNSVVVTDTKSKLELIRQTLGKLDAKAPQVMIESATEVFDLKFANAKDIEKVITTLLSSDGKVVIDERLNSIVVTDTKTTLELIRQTLSKLDAEAPQEMIESSIPEPEDPIATEIFKLNFADAKDIEKIITTLLSSDGKMGIEERLNSIVVTDTKSNLELIRQTLSELDIKAPQVMIEVLIVDAKLTDELKMGIDWTKLGTSDFFFSQGLSATTGLNPFGKLTFSATPGNWSIQGLLDFIETNEDIRILANPKVLVLNKKTAMIDAVEEIPYQQLSETSAGGSIGTTAFKEAGIKLRVTPQITDDGYIIMHVMPEQSAQVSTFVIENSETPVIETRRADTTLRVRDGQTIIIGGLRRNETSVVESKVPILGDIPLIGGLFRKKVTRQIESELGIFITPHIYTEGKLSEEELGLIERTEEKKSVYEGTGLLKDIHEDLNPDYRLPKEIHDAIYSHDRAHLSRLMQRLRQTPRRLR